VRQRKSKPYDTSPNDYQPVEGKDYEVTGTSSEEKAPWEE
jgi:hypothetical protein